MVLGPVAHLGVPTAFIGELFAAVDAREWERLDEFYTEDATYERPGFALLVGLCALTDFYANVRNIASGAHELGGTMVVDDTAACWGRFSGWSRDGRELDERFADVYELRDGKICKRTTFFFRPAV